MTRTTSGFYSFFYYGAYRGMHRSLNGRDSETEMCADIRKYKVKFQIMFVKNILSLMGEGKFGKLTFRRKFVVFPAKTEWICSFNLTIIHSCVRGKNSKRISQSFSIANLILLPAAVSN